MIIKIINGSSGLGRTRDIHNKLLLPKKLINWKLWSLQTTVTFFSVKLHNTLVGALPVLRSTRVRARELRLYTGRVPRTLQMYKSHEGREGQAVHGVPCKLNLLD